MCREPRKPTSAEAIPGHWFIELVTTTIHHFNIRRCGGQVSLFLSRRWNSTFTASTWIISWMDGDESRKVVLPSRLPDYYSRVVIARRREGLLHQVVAPGRSLPPERTYEHDCIFFIFIFFFSTWLVLGLWPSLRVFCITHRSSY